MNVKRYFAEFFAELIASGSHLRSLELIASAPLTRLQSIPT